MAPEARMNPGVGQGPRLRRGHGALPFAESRRRLVSALPGSVEVLMRRTEMTRSQVVGALARAIAEGLVVRGTGAARSRGEKSWYRRR